MAAIYAWFGAAVEYITTTLYPVEAIDSVALNASIKTGSMSLVPGEEFDVGHDIVSGSYIQLRWFYTDGPYIDEFEVSHNVTSGSYIQLRWFYVDGPYDEAFDVSHDLESSSYTLLLIEADSPDESLQLSCVINASCSMTGV